MNFKLFGLKNYLSSALIFYLNEMLSWGMFKTLLF